MEDKSQDNNPLMELIFKKFLETGWKQVELAERSGVPAGKISTFFGPFKHPGKYKRKENIGIENVYKLLTALGLLKDESGGNDTKPVVDVEKTNQELQLCECKLKEKEALIYTLQDNISLLKEKIAGLEDVRHAGKVSSEKKSRRE